jgi:hypothetical protein
MKIHNKCNSIGSFIAKNASISDLASVLLQIWLFLSVVTFPKEPRQGQPFLLLTAFFANESSIVNEPLVTTKCKAFCCNSPQDQ